MNDWRNFGQRVRDRRTTIGISQEQLAVRTGLSVRTVRDIEHGRVRSPQHRSVRLLTTALDEPPAVPPARSAVSATDSAGRADRFDIGVLGPLRLRRDGIDVTLGSAMQRTVLGLLAVQPGLVVVRQDLVDLLWGDDPPPSSQNLVHTYVARLRKTLAGTGPVIEVASGGYRLRVEPGERAGTIDVLTFDTAVASARDSATEGDLPGAVAALEHALDLWHGAPLADLDERVRGYPGIVALHRRRLASALEYAELAATTGAPGPAATRLLAVVRDEPLHEALTAHLMLLLAASGQQDQALAVFAAVRDRLAEDLGVDPGPELREAHHRVLCQDVPAIPPHRTAARTPRAPGQPSTATRWYGPRGHLTRLVGRDAALAELIALLGDHRLVTVTGPAGCGKSTLALYAAERHRGDVVVLPLGTLSEGDDPVPALAALVGRGDGDPTADLLGAVAPLLVLDNAEHLAASVTPLIARLLGSCPELVILATSQWPLGLSEEVTWALSPLAVPTDDGASPATELFRERARQALPSVDLSDSAAIAHLARRVDGLPLALELAAARVRAMPVPQLVDRLDVNLEMLSVDTAPGAGSGEGYARHRTLHSAIDHSYRLLRPDEQRVLAELSVFGRPFTLEDAEAVSHRGDSTVLALINLVDRSLLIADTEAGRSRFRLLETVREYAAARLDESGERAETERRHRTVVQYGPATVDRPIRS